MLAVGTIEGGAAALDDAPDGPGTCARLAFTVVHGKTFGEIAELAIGACEIEPLFQMKMKLPRNQEKLENRL
jgi:hypothetical protein